MSVEDTRLGVLTLAKWTGWSLAEISEIEIGEFLEWLKAIPVPKQNTK
jgi:hypothetical protein